MTLRRLSISQEEIDGIMRQELEYTFYAKLKNPDQLKDAIVIEKHEQWNIPLDTEEPVRQRLRLIDDRRYTTAVKVKVPGVLGFKEVEDDISKDLFNALKLTGVKGYIKVRHIFKTKGGLKWEIDQFMDQTGNPHPWVKIDLEVKSENDQIPDLPIDVEELIIDNSPKQTAKEIAFVDSLWEKEWLRLDRNLKD